MKKTVSEILTEATVRRAVMSMNDNPGRNLRNLIETGKKFCKGSYQKHFLSRLYDKLSDENDKCYIQLEEIIKNSSAEHLVTLGMNIGYRSLSAGAEIIRNIEKKEGFNIPWNISLEFSGKEYRDNPEKYNRIIGEGAALGIYTYSVFPTDSPAELLRLAETNTDITLLLFLAPEEIDFEFIRKCHNINNIVCILKVNQNTEKKARLLAEKGIVYSCYHKYNESEAENKNHKLILEKTGGFNPFFTVFIPDESCSVNTIRTVYEDIKTIRENKWYPTLPFEWIYDNMVIDEIISEEACSANFDINGNIHCFFNNKTSHPVNIYNSNLKEAFKISFPKQ